MSRLMKCAVVLALAATVPVAAQRGAPAAPLPGAAPAGEVLGVGTFIHLVSDVNKSLAFYSELFGTMVNGAAGPRQFAPNPVVASLYGTPGSDFRGGTVRIPSTELGGAELSDWNVSDRARVQPRPQDPGSTTLVLTVKDLDVAAAALGMNGGAILTPGGQPVAMGATKAVLGKDPDGFLIELVQSTSADPVAPAATANSNITNVRFRVAVADLVQTTKFYREVLGFPMQPATPFAADKAAADVEGLAGAQTRKATSLVPGTTLQMEFVEFRGVDRTPLQPSSHGIGGSILRLRVRDMDSMVKNLTAAGATIASANNQPVTFANGQRMVIVAEPNHLFLQPVQAAPLQPRQP